MRFKETALDFVQVVVFAYVIGCLLGLLVGRFLL